MKALAIRERKIHIVGRPELKINGTPVYLDVEGDPDRDFYYLIGLRVESQGHYAQYSFWANEQNEEKEIWISFLRTLEQIENPQLIYYGSYETIFLKRMKDRYGEGVDSAVFLERLMAEAINLVSVIYAKIYFPTYSNGLKEIAQYLGYQWSMSYASGVNALMWRRDWEMSPNDNLKQTLTTYNAEDCEAAERITVVIIQLGKEQAGAGDLKDNDIVYADSLPNDNSLRFKDNDFLMPEFSYINQAAYWDYQREKIYVRSSVNLKRIAPKNTNRGPRSLLPVNKIIECPAPNCCPKCKATSFSKQNKLTKVVYDFKFFRTGVKRWIVRYLFYRYLCCICGTTFYSLRRPCKGEKYGTNILAYMVYQIIDLQLPQTTVTESLNELFHLRIDRSTVNRQKSRVAQLYNCTYERIIEKIKSGKLIHADETKISIGRKNAFVWVFTNMEEVAYFYAETREGNTAQILLKEFKGVLVSDFYTAYDSIDCPQQKCLIHLMRDLNEDLSKQPYNEEFKELVRQFALLLKPIVETVDHFGLKSRFLRKHKVCVIRFYKWLYEQDYTSEIASKYKKRFHKNRDKLFTFLDYDGIPWNNNNAEHAVKAFATLRNVIGGTSSEKGIREYLILLSICETCKYKGISFLKFLRSGEKDIDLFVK